MADSHLYGVKQASKSKAREISSSTSLAFSSNLASLISSSSSKSTSGGAGRARPTKNNNNKSDIFTAHNKNVKKRAAADILDDDGNGGQRHQTRDDIGSVDAVDLQRSKHKMEEKVRLYNAMKRGDHHHRSKKGRYHHEEDHGLVDFDRKWAESQAAGRGSSEEDSDASSSEENNTQDHGNEIVEYTDEFGRRRKGTRAAAEREERRQRIQATARREAEELAARPSLPSSVIYGDTVQHAAFNPDQVVADRMAEIAKKRDKSATPPPDTHFDASAEVRTKGTGFYTFSHDSEKRKEQMDALERERLETERIREEREQKKRQRKEEIEKRKKAIAEQRSKAQADKFLNDFELEPS